MRVMTEEECRDRTEYINKWCNFMAKQYHHQINWREELLSYVRGVPIATIDFPTQRDVEEAKKWTKELPESVAEKHFSTLHPCTFAVTLPKKAEVIC